MMQFLTVTNSFANITKKDYLDYLKNKVIPRILITEEASFISKKTNAILKIALKVIVIKNFSVQFLTKE